MPVSALVHLGGRVFEARQAADVAVLKPAAGQKVHYSTTAVVMQGDARFPQTGIIRRICPLPEHKYKNVSAAKRCGCPENTFIPRYDFFASPQRVLLPSPSLAMSDLLFYLQLQFQAPVACLRRCDWKGWRSYVVGWFGA